MTPPTLYVLDERPYFGEADRFFREATPVEIAAAFVPPPPENAPAPPPSEPVLGVMRRLEKALDEMSDHASGCNATVGGKCNCDLPAARYDAGFVLQALEATVSPAPVPPADAPDAAPTDEMVQAWRALIARGRAVEERHLLALCDEVLRLREEARNV